MPETDPSLIMSGLRAAEEGDELPAVNEALGYAARAGWINWKAYQEAAAMAAQGHYRSAALILWPGMKEPETVGLSEGGRLILTAFRHRLLNGRSRRGKLLKSETRGRG